MLLAEELALIAIDPESGRHSIGTRDNLNACLAALLVVDVMLDATPTDGVDRVPILTAAAGVLDEKRGKVKSALSHMNRGLQQRLGLGTWDAVVSGLVEAGLVAADDGGVHSRNRVIDSAARDAIVGTLQAAAAGDDPLPARTAALLSMTGPAQLLELVSPDRQGRKHARKRIDTALDSTSLESVGASVRKVLAEAAAVAAAAGGAAVIAVSSS
jgi:hypothetical protein